MTREFKRGDAVRLKANPTDAWVVIEEAKSIAGHPEWSQAVKIGNVHGHDVWVGPGAIELTRPTVSYGRILNANPHQGSVYTVAVQDPGSKDVIEIKVETCGGAGSASVVGVFALDESGGFEELPEYPFPVDEDAVIEAAVKAYDERDRETPNQDLGRGWRKRMREACDAADEAFWAVIAKAFPEAKTGDLDPPSVLRWDQVRDKTVREWVQTNAVEPNLPPEGARVRVRAGHRIERYPHFIVPEGWEGTVERDDDGSVGVLFDRYIKGCGEWDNVVWWGKGDDSELWAVLAEVEVIS